MPELYSKDDNGQLKKIADVNNDTAHHIVNDINGNVLETKIKEFWSKEKCGKHPEIGKKHKDILNRTLRAKPEDFFEQLNENRFILKTFGPRPLNKFLAEAKIDDYVSQDYIKLCNDVHTPEPAIGKGEFLIVSTYKNINFSFESGDLIDDEGNKIEVKGVKAQFGGDRGFKQMSKNVIFGIFREFESNRNENGLTLEVIDELSLLLQENTEKTKTVMKQLQNMDGISSDRLADDMAAIFSKTKDLKNIIAAAHLMIYAKLQKANYLLAFNDKNYACFKISTSFEDAYEIVKNNFDVNGWTNGDRGITITLR